MLKNKKIKNLELLNWNENWNGTRTRTRLKVLIKCELEKKYY